VQDRLTGGESSAGRPRDVDVDKTRQRGRGTDQDMGALGEKDQRAHASPRKWLWRNRDRCVNGWYIRMLRRWR
jgi:hypothetical protein